MELPVYWINLDRRADRRKRCLDYFRENGITNHIRITPPEGHRPKVSCCLAHANAVLAAFRDGVEYAMIIEDDVILDAAAWRRVQESVGAFVTVMEEEGRQWDCYQVHWIDPYLSEELVKVGAVENVFLQGYLMSSACYVMCRAGMERFLKKMGVFDEKGGYKVTAVFYDGAISEEFVFNHIQTYTQLIPPVNTIEEGISDVQTGSLNIEWNWRNMVALEGMLERWGVPRGPSKKLSVSWCGGMENAREVMKELC